MATDAASSGCQILAIAATLDRHVSAIALPAHRVAAMRGDFLDAYDLNFFIKTFDLGHEHFLMNQPRAFEQRVRVVYPGLAMQAEDAICLTRLQATGLCRPWAWRHARKFRALIGDNRYCA